jgi:hypothetical protein
MRRRITLLVIATIFLTSCSSVQESSDKNTLDREKLPKRSISLATSQVDYLKALGELHANGCTNDKKASERNFTTGNLSAASVNHRFFYDYGTYEKELPWGTSLERAKIATGIYLAKLEDIDFYLNKLNYPGMKSFKSSYAVYSRIATNAFSQVCKANLERESLIAYLVENSGLEATSIAKYDKYCRNNLDKSEFVFPEGKIVCYVKFKDDSSMEENSKSVLDNLVFNSGQFLSWYELAIKTGEDISAEIDANYQDSITPDCREYPSNNPKYTVVKCTNLP